MNKIPQQKIGLEDLNNTHYVGDSRCFFYGELPLEFYSLTINKMYAAVCITISLLKTNTFYN